jgi:ligand-binding sensor domain-containing protein
MDLRVFSDGKLTLLGKAEGLPGTRVWCIEEDRDGGLWIGTDGGGIARLENEKFKAYSMNHGLSNDFVRALHEDREGSADVKPESDPALQEIAKLLKQDSKLKIYVVGHTDSQGTLNYNMDLSQRRSEAVVRSLTTQHGIVSSRLMAKGLGPLAPVESNDSDAGRAKNRRVELVKQ